MLSSVSARQTRGIASHAITLATREEMENQRIDEVFGEDFLKSNFWLYTPARLKDGPAPAWDLWRRIAAKDSAFGRPNVFGGDTPKTKWASATITTLDARIPRYIERIAKRDPFSGKVVTAGIVTVKDSSWLLSWTVSRQPHFRKQPKDQVVGWLYALFVDRPGDYVKKPMQDCTGEEITPDPGALNRGPPKRPGGCWQSPGSLI
ncbi:oleate hydratase [Luteibacter jiangsuensis]